MKKYSFSYVPKAPEVLAVFSERKVAFSTAEELCGRLISAPGLDLPYVSGVVAAFGTLNSHGGERAQLLLFLPYYSHELLGVVLNDFACVWVPLSFQFPVSYNRIWGKQVAARLLCRSWLSSVPDGNRILDRIPFLVTPYRFCVPPLL